MNPLLRKRMAPRATRMEQSKVPPMPTLRELAPDTVRRFPDLLKFDAALTQWRERLMSLPVDDQSDSATTVAEAIAAVPQVPGPKGDKGDPGETGLQGPRGAQGPAGSSTVARLQHVPTTLRAYQTYRLPDDSQEVYAMPIVLDLGAVLDIGYNSVLTELGTPVVLPSGVIEKTATYAIVAATDYCISCTSGTFVVTLPTAVGIGGQQFVIQNLGSGTITVDTTSGQTINGDPGGSLLLGQHDSVRVISNGLNWIII